MSRYDYVERPPTGGWILEVRKGEKCVGNIRQSRTTRRYQFFRGSKNAIRAMLEEPTLDALKADVELLDL
jgi:hypothetical protein